MKSEFIKVFIAKDGTRFNNREDALEHEKMLEIFHFESTDELLVAFTKTEVWKTWEKDLNVRKSDVLGLKREVENLAERLEEEYPHVLIGSGKNFIDIDVVLWRSFEEDAVVSYFKAQTSLKFPDERIFELFRKAYSENHSYGFNDTLDEFSRYIEALDIMLT